MKRWATGAAALGLLLGVAGVRAGWGDRTAANTIQPLEGFKAAAKDAAPATKDKDAAPATNGAGNFSVFDTPAKQDKKAGKAVAAGDKDARERPDQGDKDAKKEAKPAVEKKSDARPPSLADEVAAERERETQALLRRQMVCLKLMRIAMDNNDDELLRKAEQLDEQAREVYARRTAHLPGSRQANFDSDERTLERHLGPTDRPTRGHSQLLIKDKAAPQSAQAREDRP